MESSKPIEDPPQWLSHMHIPGVRMLLQGAGQHALGGSQSDPIFMGQEVVWRILFFRLQVWKLPLPPVSADLKRGPSWLPFWTSGITQHLRSPPVLTSPWSSPAPPGEMTLYFPLRGERPKVQTRRKHEADWTGYMQQWSMIIWGNTDPFILDWSWNERHGKSPSDERKLKKTAHTHCW